MFIMLYILCVCTLIFAYYGYMMPVGLQERSSFIISLFLFSVSLKPTRYFTRYCTFFVYQISVQPLFFTGPRLLGAVFINFFYLPLKRLGSRLPGFFLPALPSSKKARLLGAVFLDFLLLAPASFKKARLSNTDINKTFCAIFA